MNLNNLRYNYQHMGSDIDKYQGDERETINAKLAKQKESADKDVTEGDNVHVKPKENTNAITNRVEDESSVTINFKIASGATVDPNAPVITNIVKASEVTHDQQQLVQLQPKEVESITTGVVAGVLNPAAPGNGNAISVTNPKSKGTGGDELMLVKGQAKLTRDVPASIALARIYNAVNPVVQARQMSDSHDKAGQTPIAARYVSVAEGIKDDQSERKAAGQATNSRTGHVCDASSKSIAAKDHVVKQQVGTAGDRALTPVIPTTRQQHATSQVGKSDGVTTANSCAQNNAATTPEVGVQTKDKWTVVIRSPTKRNVAPGVKNQQQNMSVPTARQTASKVVTSPNSFEAVAEEVNVGVNSLTVKDTRFIQQITPYISSSKQDQSSENLSKKLGV
ncbi:hypothetical protein A4A49_31001 [Nicotiana attenuata]|uniref:Uncharacterized protein n=1 Tax=Nicotiana attenuata TaxID=49451 RepID=A0A314KZD1_NICAT|nr:hypothetical protein A4A49_31001 [Nicotiana attenuata]